MPLRTGARPSTLRARLNRLERELTPYETPAQRLSKAMVTEWLAQSEDGADLWLEYLERLEVSGSVSALLTQRAGRELALRMVDSFYEQDEPSPASSTFDA